MGLGGQRTFAAPAPILWRWLLPGSTQTRFRRGCHCSLSIAMFLGAVVRAACKAFDPSFKSDCVQLDRTSVVLCASIAGALERRLLRYGGIAEKARL